MTIVGRTAPRPWLLHYANDLIHEAGNGGDGLGAVRGLILGLVMSSSLWLAGAAILKL